MRFVHMLCIQKLIFLVFFSSAGAEVADTTLARRIIEHADSLMRGSSNYGLFKMTIVRPDWSRSMTMHSWERGNDLSFIEVVEPAKEAGTAFLKRKGQMWSWLPDIERTIKIPPSMMMDSWMGSDFTNDDLVHESSIVEDYAHRYLGQDTVGAEPGYVVELKPKPEAPVVWGRIVACVRQRDFIPLKYEYYDEKGRLVRVMSFENIRKLGGRLIPSLWRLVPQLKKDQETVFEINEMEFDIDIPDRIFTRQHLERSR